MSSRWNKPRKISLRLKALTKPLIIYPLDLKKNMKIICFFLILISGKLLEGTNYNFELAQNPFDSFVKGLANMFQDLIENDSISINQCFTGLFKVENFEHLCSLTYFKNSIKTGSINN